MGTLRQLFDAPAMYPATSNSALFRRATGTNFPVDGMSFDGTTSQTAFLRFRAIGYGSGNLTLSLVWYAASASSGDVGWSAAVAAITPNSDTQDVETKAFATANTVTDSHLGTTGKRVHECQITISNVDSIAAGDIVWVKLTRDTSVGSNMSGLAVLLDAELSYSDT